MQAFLSKSCKVTKPFITR